MRDSEKGYVSLWDQQPHNFPSQEMRKVLVHIRKWYFFTNGSMGFSEHECRWREVEQRQQTQWPSGSEMNITREQVARFNCILHIKTQVLEEHAPSSGAHGQPYLLTILCLQEKLKIQIIFCRNLYLFFFEESFLLIQNPKYKMQSTFSIGHAEVGGFRALCRSQMCFWGAGRQGVRASQRLKGRNDLFRVIRL